MAEERNWLTTALDLEEKGRRHYLETVRTCRNPVGREVFQMLADYEVQHIERIREIAASPGPGRPWTEGLASFEVPTDLGRVFRALTGQHQARQAEADEVAALEMGLEFESASIKFYQDRQAQARDPLEKKFLGLMVAEERGHLNLLSDLRLYYTDPESWYLEKDRVTLDGA
ncbi:MAG: ferritin family protein [Thermodesulfobacteriota bacterium]